MTPRNKFLANVEWLAVRVGVEIHYDPQEEWFVVKTGNGQTVSNCDLYEAVDVAREFVELEAK